MDYCMRSYADPADRNISSLARSSRHGGLRVVGMQILVLTISFQKLAYPNRIFMVVLSKIQLLKY